MLTFEYYHLSQKHCTISTYYSKAEKKLSRAFQLFNNPISDLKRNLFLSITLFRLVCLTQLENHSSSGNLCIRVRLTIYTNLSKRKSFRENPL